MGPHRALSFWICREIGSDCPNHESWVLPEFVIPWMICQWMTLSKETVPWTLIAWNGLLCHLLQQCFIASVICCTNTGSDRIVLLHPFMAHASYLLYQCILGILEHYHYVPVPVRWKTYCSCSKQPLQSRMLIKYLEWWLCLDARGCTKVASLVYQNQPWLTLSSTLFE